MTLINELLPAAANVFTGPTDRALGGLTSTFLLSMAGPMLTLPIERIERQLQKKEREGYADDRRLNPTLSDAVKKELGGGRFRRAPFFAPGQWSFTEWPADINIANEMPTELCTALGSDEAFVRAAALETTRWCSCLRNALAHGGIAYLNGYGHSSYHGGPVEMFCFISGKYAERGDETPVALNCLRIRESHFLDFLQRWVNWLEASSVMKQLAA
ncbi:hypothetical protein [Bradyrhizobium retamae]|uniref:Uncharacterized protein n=1 Tax=Bradyrhizobium retamae TaxID=1300035 RepID=A0A0R3NB94_9BRAD|nr:hypothetical protein [Bradyrhizobium retamae]KRR29625.1 hypothetical protein CQ13_38390 [Bradyrhizobium retamae]